MKITKSRLTQLIREELEGLLNEVLNEQLPGAQVRGPAWPGSVRSVEGGKGTVREPKWKSEKTTPGDPASKLPKDPGSYRQGTRMDMAPKRDDGDPGGKEQEGRDRAEKEEAVDHIAHKVGLADGKAGRPRKTEAPESWSEVAKQWLTAYNSAYNKAKKS